MEVTAYDEFLVAHGERLRLALVAAYGPDAGADAAADAVAYGWEHWDRLRVVDEETWEAVAAP